MPESEDGEQSSRKKCAQHAHRYDGHMVESSAGGRCHSIRRHFQNGPRKETEQCVFGTVCPREGLTANSIRFSGQVLIGMGATPYPRSYSPPQELLPPATKYLKPMLSMSTQTSNFAHTECEYAHLS